MVVHNAGLQPPREFAAVMTDTQPQGSRAAYIKMRDEQIRAAILGVIRNRRRQAELVKEDAADGHEISNFCEWSAVWEHMDSLIDEIADMQLYDP